MRLDDSDFNSINSVWMAPFVRNVPEDEWANAARDGVIPPSLYDLYQ
jgi:hypothetical protein